MEVSHAQIAESIAALHRRIEKLDDTIRGDNGDGLTVRLARAEGRAEANSAAVGRAFHDLERLRRDHGETRDWLMRIDRRLVFWSGGAAALGGMLGVLAKALLTKVL